eukprot:9209340-Alexandrium_andersonii.AAC.1
MTSRATPEAPGRLPPFNGFCLRPATPPAYSPRPTPAAGSSLNSGPLRLATDWPPSRCCLLYTSPSPRD